MYDTPSTQRLGGDAGDFSLADAHIAHRIQAGLGIHDSSTFEHQIVLLRRRNARRAHKKTERENQSAHNRTVILNPVKISDDSRTKNIPDLPQSLRPL